MAEDRRQPESPAPTRVNTERLPSLPPPDGARRMRSVEVLGIAGVALVGGALVADAAGLFRRPCEQGQLIYTAAGCPTGNAECMRLFATGAAYVAVTGTGPSARVEPLRWQNSGYVDSRGQPFPGSRACTSSSSSSGSGRSGGSWAYFGGWGGGSSSSSTAPSSVGPSSAQRSGFGTTARSFSVSSSS